LWSLLVDSAGICHRISILSGILFDRFRREGPIAFDRKKRKKKVSVSKWELDKNNMKTV